MARQLSQLDALRQALGDATAVPVPWLGQLRRQVRASTAESSISIEGFSVPAGDAISILSGVRAGAPSNQDRLAFECYSRAMDHVGVMALDPEFKWSPRVILDLHFDACHFQRDRSPGLWRSTPVAVTAPDGGVAYQAPAATDVPVLMGQLVDRLQHDDPDTHIIVRAAMAHLHVVSIHPFSDGNGRIARIIQSLVLAREGLTTPEFNSIEEYLGTATSAYYAALQRVQAGQYLPTRDATPWVQFCITAHLEQAQVRLDQIAAAARRWAVLEAYTIKRGWPDRFVIAMEHSLFEGIDRPAYAAEADVSASTATNDIRRLVDAGLVRQRGRTRTTRYVATDALRRLTA